MVDAPSCYNQSNNDGTLINAYNDLRLHDAIKSHNGPALKKMFLDPSQEIPLSDLSAEYTKQLSMLKLKDENGNTPFHLLVLSQQSRKGNTRLMQWIVNYLHEIAHKIGKDIDLKNDIQAILAIENKEQLTALNISIMHGHELFIKILLNDEYLSKDMAEAGVKFAQSRPDPRANGLVGLLKDYINKQDSSQATVTPDELSKDGYISSLKSWLATTLAHSHHMADSISKQLIEWLKINKRNNQNIFAYLISNEALNKGSSALDMVTQILNLLGDPLENHNVQEFMDQMFREPDNDGLNFIQLLVIHDRKALLQVFIDNKYTIPNDIAAGALALANRYPNKQGTFELLKAYLSEQNKSLPTQGIDIPDIAFKSPGLSSTNIKSSNVYDKIYKTIDLHTFTENNDIDAAILYLKPLHRNERIRAIYYTMRQADKLSPFYIAFNNRSKDFLRCLLQQTTVPHDILANAIQLASAWQETELVDVLNQFYLKHRCDKCPYACKFLSNFKNHERVHTEDKRYKCDTCGQVFTQNGHLKRHQSVHTEVKSHKCNMCDKAFKEKQYLKRHQSVHTEVKSYKCNMCHKAFKEKEGLQKHQRRHTGEKPYKWSYM